MKMRNNNLQLQTLLNHKMYQPRHCLVHPQKIDVVLYLLVYLILAKDEVNHHHQWDQQVMMV